MRPFVSLNSEIAGAEVVECPGETRHSRIWGTRTGNNARLDSSVFVQPAAVSAAQSFHWSALGASLIAVQLRKRAHRASTQLRWDDALAMASKPSKRRRRLRRKAPAARAMFRCAGSGSINLQASQHNRGMSGLTAILVIYFVQGALGLARLAITFRLKDDLGLPPAEVAGLMGVINLPWILKPFYGFLSDALPLFGSHRRSYLVLAGFLGSGAWLYLASGAQAAAAIIAGATVASLAVAVADVVADSIVVERTRAAEELGDRTVAGSLQSSCWLAQALGGLASAYFSGSLLESCGVQVVFLATAVLPLLVSIFALTLQEPPAGTLQTAAVASSSLADGSLQTLEDADAPVGVRLRLLWSAITDRRILVPLAVLFLWLAKPSTDMVFLFFLNNDLGMGPEMLGRLRLAEAAASLGGIIIYRTWLRETPTRKIFFGTTMAYLPFCLVQMILVSKLHRRWGVPDLALAFGDDVALTALGQLAFMPTLTLAARLCPPGIEGALFATLMSVYNLARIVGQETGGLLTKVVGVTQTDFTRFPLLLAICTILSLMPLPFLRVFDRADGLAGTLGDGKQEKLAK